MPAWVMRVWTVVGMAVLGRLFILPYRAAGYFAERAFHPFGVPVTARGALGDAARARTAGLCRSCAGCLSAAAASLCVQSVVCACLPAAAVVPLRLPLVCHRSVTLLRTCTALYVIRSCCLVCVSCHVLRTCLPAQRTWSS